MSAWLWVAAEASRTANLYRVISQGGTAAGIPVIGPLTGASRRPTLHHDEFNIIATPTLEMVASTHDDTPVATSLGVALWVSRSPSSVPESLAKQSRFLTCESSGTSDGRNTAKFVPWNMRHGPAA